MHGFVMDLEYVISLELYGVVEDGADDDAVEGGKKESVNGDDCNVEGKEYHQQHFISPPSPRRQHLSYAKLWHSTEGVSRRQCPELSAPHLRQCLSITVKLTF